MVTRGDADSQEPLNNWPCGSNSDKTGNRWSQKDMVYRVPITFIVKSPRLAVGYEYKCLHKEHWL